MVIRLRRGRLQSRAAAEIDHGEDGMIPSRAASRCDHQPYRFQDGRP
jgi:hypothetical protein